jgi:hypothetical protein
MRWIEAEVPSRRLPSAVVGAMLRQAAAKGDASPQLAKALYWNGDYDDAAAQFENLARRDPVNFRRFVSLAMAYLRSGRYVDALAACDRADAAGEPVHWLRGKALRKMGRDADAIAELRAVFAREGGLATLSELLEVLARQDDGHALLAACDQAPPDCAASAPVLAYRAIALSRLGRGEEAMRLVDLDRHVARERISVPAGFADIEAFNDALAREILAAPSPDSPVRDGLDVNYEPFVSDSPAFAALHGFMRGAMERYLSALPRRGLDRVLPPAPEAGSFFTANVVLRQDGHNGEHIHGLGYVSAVYHVRVPASVAAANDERGALALGVCASHTNGYEPCWGVRHIKPEAGWLTLFPSHIFHDVVPSRTDEARISVVADLRPLRDTP